MTLRNEVTGNVLQI